MNIWNYPPPHLIRILISTDDDDTGGDDDDDDEGLTEADVVFSIFVDDTPVCFTLAEGRSTSLMDVCTANGIEAGGSVCFVVEGSTTLIDKRAALGSLSLAVGEQIRSLVPEQALLVHFSVNGVDVEGPSTQTLSSVCQTYGLNYEGCMFFDDDEGSNTAIQQLDPDETLGALGVVDGTSLYTYNPPPPLPVTFCIDCQEVCSAVDKPLLDVYAGLVGAVVEGTLFYLDEDAVASKMNAGWPHNNRPELCAGETLEELGIGDGDSVSTAVPFAGFPPNLKKHDNISFSVDKEEISGAPTDTLVSILKRFNFQLFGVGYLVDANGSKLNRHATLAELGISNADQLSIRYENNEEEEAVDDDESDGTNFGSDWESDGYMCSLDGMNDPNIFRRHWNPRNTGEVYAEYLTPAEKEACEKEEARCQLIRREYHATLKRHQRDFLHTCDLCQRRWIGLGPWRDIPFTAKHTEWCGSCAGHKDGKTTTPFWSYNIPFERLFSPKLHLGPDDLPALSFGELSMITPVQAHVSITALRRRGGSGKSTGPTKLKSGVTLIAKDIDERIATVPMEVTDLRAFVLRSHDGTDEECRKAAGFTCDLRNIYIWYRYLLDNNKIWRDWIQRGKMNVDAARLDALAETIKTNTNTFDDGVDMENNVINVQMVDESEKSGGLQDLRKHNFGDDCLGKGTAGAKDGSSAGSDRDGAGSDDADSDDSPGHLLDVPTTVNVVVDLVAQGHGHLVKDVIAGANAASAGSDAQSPYVSHREPGVEALVWPHLFPDGECTYAGDGVGTEDNPKWKQPPPYIRMMLMKAGGKFRRDRTFGPIQYRWHLEQAIRSRSSFMLDKEFANITFEDLAEMVENEDKQVYYALNSTLRAIPGSNEYLKQKQRQAEAQLDTMVHCFQHAPIGFATESIADPYHPFQQQMPKFGTMSHEDVRLQLNSGLPLERAHEELGDDWSERYDNISTDYGASSMAQHLQLDALAQARRNLLHAAHVILGKELQARLAWHQHEMLWIALGYGCPRPMSIGPDGRPYYRTAAGQRHFNSYFATFVAAPGHPSIEKELLDLGSPHDSTSKLYQKVLKQARANPGSEHPAGSLVELNNFEGCFDPDYDYKQVMRTEATGQAILQLHYCTTEKCLIPSKRRPYPQPRPGFKIIVLTQPDGADGAKHLTMDRIKACVDLLVAARPRPAKTPQYGVGAVTVKDDGSEAYVEVTSAAAKVVLEQDTLELPNQRGPAPNADTFTVEDSSKFSDVQICKNMFPARPREDMEVKRTTLKQNDGRQRLVSKPARIKGSEMGNQYLAKGDFGRIATANTDFKLLPGASAGYRYVLKYALKELYGKDWLEHCKTLLSAVLPTSAAGTSARSLIVQAVVALQRSREVSVLEVMDYFLHARGDHAVVTLPTVYLDVGGWFGFLGMRDDVQVTFNDDGNGGDAMTIAADALSLYWQYAVRFQRKYTWHDSVTASDVDMLHHITPYVFTAYFTLDEEKMEFAWRQEQVGVHIRPIKHPAYAFVKKSDDDDDNAFEDKPFVDPDFAKQAMFVYTPWELPEGCVQDEASLQHILDFFEEEYGSSDHSEQWLTYCNRTFLETRFGAEGDDAGNRLAPPGFPKLRLIDLDPAGRPLLPGCDLLRSTRARSYCQ